MSDTILMAQGDRFIGLPRETWEANLVATTGHVKANLAFMTEDHHRVRNFTVRELPRTGAPLTPGFIAENLALPLDRIQTLLGELERHMTFLYRNGDGAVAWAYPVTVDPTPHGVSFSTGETLYAA